MNAVTKWIAKQLNLLTVDQVTAIRPQIAADADRARLSGASDLADAANKREKAAVLNAQADGLEANGNRRVEAVEAFRKASGG